MSLQELGETVPAIDCTEFVLLVDELVETDPEEWSAVVRKHLRDCLPCLTYLELEFAVGFGAEDEPWL